MKGKKEGWNERERERERERNRSDLIVGVIKEITIINPSLIEEHGMYVA